MKKVLALLLLIFTSSVQAKVVTIQQPAAPQYLNFDGTHHGADSTNYPKVTELERAIFKKDYSSQLLEYRLSRLEKSVFGAIQRGSLNDRVDKLTSATSILTQNNTYDGDTSAAKAKRGLANLGNLLLGGQLTGYTPPVYNDPYYASQYYNNYSTYNPQVPTYTPQTYNQNYSNPYYSYGGASSWYGRNGQYRNHYGTSSGTTGVQVIY